MEFNNRKMLDWAAEYFQKKGVAKIPTQRNESIGTLKNNVLNQAFCYFSANINDEVNNQNLSKMKRSWEQYKRRKKPSEKSYSVSIDEKTYRLFESIKKRNKLNNLSQAAEYIIKETVFQREIARLDDKNRILINKMGKLKELERKYIENKKLLDELRNKTKSLEKDNSTLTDTIKTLNNLLNRTLF